MIERLETTLNRYNEIAEELSKPEVLGNVELMTTLSKEQSQISEIVDKYKVYKKVLSDDIDERNSRIYLINIVANILKQGCALLGIEMPEKM